MELERSWSTASAGLKHLHDTAPQEGQGGVRGTGKGARAPGACPAATTAAAAAAAVFRSASPPQQRPWPSPSAPLLLHPPAAQAFDRGGYCSSGCAGCLPLAPLELTLGTSQPSTFFVDLSASLLAAMEEAKGAPLGR